MVPEIVGVELSEPLTLPNGQVIATRLVKAALAECQAQFGGGPPTQKHIKLYTEWCKGQWGMIITGNVQIDEKYLSMPWDLSLPTSFPSGPKLQRWKNLASLSNPSSPILVQLNHPGRQSARCFGRRTPWTQPVSPSPLRAGTKDWTNTVLFSTPRMLEDVEVDAIIERFGECATWVEKIGFGGVEIHASHGYLLAQFLSPLTNLRSPSTSAYACTPSGWTHLLSSILHSIRRQTSSSFILGIKLSSSDFHPEGFGLTPELFLDQVRAIRDMKCPATERGWDFIEVSGGGYERPVFAEDGTKPVFVGVSAQVVKLLQGGNGGDGERIKVVSTGGFRKREDMVEALQDGSCDSIGLGRPTCLLPQVPTILVPTSVHHLPLTSPRITVTRGLKWITTSRLPAAGISTLWYTFQMDRIARGKAADDMLGFVVGLAQFLLGGEERVALALVVGVSVPMVALWVVSRET